MSIGDLMGMGRQIETFYGGPFIVNNSAGIVNANFEQMQKSVYRAICNSDPEIVAEAIAKAKESALIIEKQLPVIREHFLGDQQIVDRLDAAFTKLKPMREHVLALASENRNAEAADYMEKNNILVIKEAQMELNSLQENGNARGEAAGRSHRPAGDSGDCEFDGQPGLWHLHNPGDHAAGSGVGEGGPRYRPGSVFRGADPVPVKG